MALPILCHKPSSSFVREILNTLLTPEVELQPSALVLGIEHREGVTSEAMDMPEGIWNSVVRHDDCVLMARLWKKDSRSPGYSERCADRAGKRRQRRSNGPCSSVDRVTRGVHLSRE